MSEADTLTFSDPDDYAAAFGGARVSLTITGAGDFAARLTRLRLQHLEMYSCCERLPRIAYMSLPPDRTALSFRVGTPSLVFAGVSLRNGDMVVHNRGEPSHQRSAGACRWGLISLSAGEFAKCGGTLDGRPVVSPQPGTVHRLARAEASRFRHLFRQACRIAETRKELTRSQELAKALEREMLAVVHRLAGNHEADIAARSRQHHAAVMARFEDALTKRIDQKLDIPTLCAEIGVAERTLRMCCAEFLGVSPSRYILLQRLNRARAELRRADLSTTTVAEIARNHQFLEFGRFAVTYRTIFGESPSATLQRDPRH